MSFLDLTAASTCEKFAHAQDVEDEHLVAWKLEALANIKRQEEIVRKMKPGCQQHKLAVGVLLLLQDSLHVLVEAHAILKRSRATKLTLTPQLSPHSTETQPAFHPTATGDEEPR